MFGGAWLFFPWSPWLAWVCFVPLLVAGLRRRFDRRFVVWSYAAMALGMCLFMVPYFAPGYGVVPAALAGLWQGLLNWLPFLVVALLAPRLGSAAALLAFPAAWTATEWLVLFQPLHLPQILGATQGTESWLIQPYAYVGVWGGSFWLAATNVLLALAWCNRRPAFALIALAMPVIPALLSYWMLRADPIDGDEIRIAVVQAAAESSRYWDLSEKARLAHRPDLLIWSETALAGAVLEDPAQRDYRRDVFRWVAGGHQPLLTGINILEGPDFYNGATLITPEFASLALSLEGPDEPRLATYRKQHLFPFVEKVPFSDTWPWLERFRMGNPNIPQGRTPADPEAMQFAFADRKGAVRQVGGIICFELLYPGLVAAAARADVDFLVMLGNDTDLMDTVTLKHLQAQARVRAVETGRDLVRADLWGPSLVANRHGEVTAIVPEGEARILAARVRASKAPSWFARHPDAVPLACNTLVLLFGIAAIAKARVARHQELV